MGTKSSHTLSQTDLSAMHALDAAADAVGSAKQHVDQFVDNVKVAVNKSVDEQPGTTLLFAAAAGFVLGALWRS